MIKFSKMIKEFYTMLNVTQSQDWVNRMFECLKWASEIPARSNILFHSSWTFDGLQNLDCYDLIEGLDSIYTVSRIAFYIAV